MNINRNPPVPPPEFSPKDFAHIIHLVPPGCPIVGGQAVAWWAQRYSSTVGKEEAVTSADIDFWGGREDLETLAEKLGVKPIFPHTYEMTVWVGAIPLNIGGQKSLADFLHTVPGLDIIDPERASVREKLHWEAEAAPVAVLSPVSLVMTKLHALRHFDQKDRQDEKHLQVSLRASTAFLSELLQLGEVRHLLWNIERLIAASSLKAYKHLEEKHHFHLLSAVPIDRIREVAYASEPPLEDRPKLVSFLERRWPQIQA
jgi:hypothetical protein